jgi:cell division protein FtsW
VVLFGALLIIAQKDYSTTLLYVGIALAMLIVVGILFRWILLFIIAIGIPAIIFLLIEPYRIKRLTGFLFPDIDPTGINWQVNNSLKAMASGGLWGKESVRENINSDHCQKCKTILFSPILSKKWE